MTEAGKHSLLFCLVVSLAWGATIKRDEVADEAESEQQPAIHECQIFDGLPTAMPANNMPVSYGVVCDAGSSSTKLKVYKINRSVRSASPRVDLIYSQRFKPGIDKYLDNQTGLQVYLTQILEAAKNIVPESQQPSTHINLLATAGLRFLSAEKSNSLVNDAKDIFRDFGHSKFDAKNVVGILSGEEEGVLSWIAANYLLGNFDYDRPDNETVGVLEMGGGSTQMTFIPHNPIYSGKYPVIIKHRKYDLYVHSYLRFGSDAISSWVMDILSERNSDSSYIGDPCMLKGDSIIANTDHASNLTFYGTSDPETCQQLLQQILRPDTGIDCEPKPCAIGNVYQPTVGDMKFYAIQGFTYVPSTLKAIGPDQVLNLELLEQAAFEHCRRNLSEAREAGVAKSFESMTCIMGLYIPTLFTLSYGFPKNTTNIKVTSEIRNTAIEWSLGTIVNQVYGDLPAPRAT